MVLVSNLEEECVSADALFNLFRSVSDPTLQTSYTSEIHLMSSGKPPTLGQKWSLRV